MKALQTVCVASPLPLSRVLFGGFGTGSVIRSRIARVQTCSKFPSPAGSQHCKVQGAPGTPR
eukprot:5057742-Alexandrium_andersonii.AAC.1